MANEDTKKIYDKMRSCNNCSCKNDIKVVALDGYVTCEAETTCTNCGFKDYWAYGFFESGTCGYNKSEKY